MKTGLSGIEIHFIIQEMQDLAGAKIDKIYQPDKNTIYLQLFKTGEGKQIVCLRLPSFIYLTQFKEESPAKIIGFCAILRKYLEGAKLESISQHKSERIVEFCFVANDQKYLLIAELFSKGNIILCKDDMTIIQPLQTQEWKTRKVAAKEKYEYPPESADILAITRQTLREQLAGDKELVKKLASSLCLGGTFAEEITLRAGADKNSKSQTSKEIDNIMSAIKSVLNPDTKPCIIKKDGAAFDVVPQKLMIYKDFESEEYSTFNSALDKFLTGLLKNEMLISRQAPEIKEISKTNTILEKQQKSLEELEKSAAENQRKGEIIYENYTTVKEIIDTIKKASEKYSWNEIKEKLSSSKIIKSIDTKEKKIVIEL